MHERMGTKRARTRDELTERLQADPWARQLRSPSVVGTAASFIELAGKSTAKVSVIGNDLAKARHTVQRSPEVAAEEVFEEANRVWRA